MQSERHSIQSEDWQTATPPKPTIDVNRGVLFKRTFGGDRIHSYKDTPGIYLDDQGHEVSVAVAKAAGFEVASDMLARQRVETAARVASMIEEYSARGDEQVLDTSEDGSLFLVSTGAGLVIRDKGGQSISPAMSETIGSQVFAQMKGIS